MAANVQHHPEGLPGTNQVLRLEKNVLGVALFITSESVFFISLIIAFVVYRGRSEAGDLDVARTAIFTVALLASSGTAMLAERAFKRGALGGGRLWLGITVLLGIAFLCNQALEYWGLLRQAITPQTNLWATTFFTLTGFHGLHVFVGLIVLCILLGLAAVGEITEHKHEALTAAGLYWHFVDGVWVVVFSLVYLWR
jgi:heme/copper-type cytochrome/quinol oxidase subunit 3